MQKGLTVEEQRVQKKLLRRKVARGAEAKRKRSPLPVYVSNEHNGALVNLHRAIRCKEIAFTKVSMLHVDSHPDLMVPPSMPASTVFQPRELHCELANSETGIAEFILPAVFAGHVDRVMWIRPPWSDQIRDGSHKFVVGEKILFDGSTGPLRVSSVVPYFSDEGLDESPDNLKNAKPLHLEVTPFDGCSADKCGDFLFNENETREWFLDVCLDYFSVNNPFRVDFLSKTSEASLKTLSQVFAFEGLKWRTIEAERNLMEDDRDIVALCSTQKKLKDEFDQIMLEWFSLYKNANGEQDSNTIDEMENTLVEKLALMYTDNTVGKDAASRFKDLMRSLSPEVRELAQSCGPNLDLPHHRSDQGTMEKMLHELKDLLLTIRDKDPLNGVPKIVTIAKSSSDEFDYTPQDQTSWILSQLLQILNELYGELEVEEDVEQDSESELSQPPDAMARP